MNEHLAGLKRQAHNFWHDWQSRHSEWAALDGAEFVQTANELLEQYFPDVAVELEGDLSAQIRTLVFTAHGMREHFPAVQVLTESAPPLDGFAVCAFRQPVGLEQRHEFAIGMDGFHLSAADVLVRLDTWREMPALDMAFAKDIEEDMMAHAQNMAVIMMDHILGEWAAAVKIDALDFVPHEGEGWQTLAELPEALDQHWRELGRSGLYPEPEWRYGQAVVGGDEDADEGQDHLILVRNQSAAALIGRADMAWTVSVVCTIGASEDLERAYELQDEFEAHAVQGQAGIPTLTVTNLSRGERTVYAATCEPEVLLAAAEKLCARFADLNARAETAYDPTWQHYRY